MVGPPTWSFFAGSQMVVPPGDAARSRARSRERRAFAQRGSGSAGEAVAGAEVTAGDAVRLFARGAADEAVNSSTNIIADVRHRPRAQALLPLLSQLGGMPEGGEGGGFFRRLRWDRLIERNPEEL